MIEIGDGAGLGEIRLGVLRVGDAFGMRHLDRHLAREIFVVGQIHEAEAPFAQDFFDSIPANPFGDLRGSRISSRVWLALG